MASNKFNLEIARKSLEDDGFFILQDHDVGERVGVFQSAGHQYGTVSALELLMEPVVSDIVSNIRVFPVGHLIIQRGSKRS